MKNIAIIDIDKMRKANKYIKSILSEEQYAKLQLGYQFEVHAITDENLTNYIIGEIGKKIETTITATPIVYAQDISEYEASWGIRPDGFIIASTREKLAEKVENVESGGTPSYHFKAGKVIAIIPTDICTEELALKGTLWIDNPLSEYGTAV